MRAGRFFLILVVYKCRTYLFNYQGSLGHDDHPSFPVHFSKKKRTPQNPIDKCPKNFTPGNQSSRRNNHIRHKQNRFPITFALLLAPSHVGESVNCFWFVTTSPATLAEVRVDITPAIMADIAKRETSPDLPGAICESMPIWVPSEQRLPKPQSAYVAMRRERSERVWNCGSVWRRVYATNSFAS